MEWRKMAGCGERAGGGCGVVWCVGILEIPLFGSEWALWNFGYNDPECEYNIHWEGRLKDPIVSLDKALKCVEDSC